MPRSWCQQETLALLGTGSYFIQQPQVLRPGLRPWRGSELRLWWDIPEEMMGHLKDDQSVPRRHDLLEPESSITKAVCMLGATLRHLNRWFWRLRTPTQRTPIPFDFEVVYAALGPDKQYFLRFRDGDTCWSLWSELSQQIKAQEQRSHRVSYATRTGCPTVYGS